MKPAKRPNDIVHHFFVIARSPSLSSVQSFFRAFENQQNAFLAMMKGTTSLLYDGFGISDFYALTTTTVSPIE
jgi:hypothetical protein